MPKLRDKVRLSLFLPAHMADRLKVKAKRDHRSVASYVRKLVLIDLDQTEQLELPLEGGR